MPKYCEIADIELIGPTSIGLRLVDAERASVTDQIVLSPANFITDFSLFLTAVRAAGETRPVEPQALKHSWEEWRETLRRRLVEEDPWSEEPTPTLEESTLAALEVTMGEERAKALMHKRTLQREHPGN
jgi:hypothetical protein